MTYLKHRKEAYPIIIAMDKNTGNHTFRIPDLKTGPVTCPSIYDCIIQSRTYLEGPFNHIIVQPAGEHHEQRFVDTDIKRYTDVTPAKKTLVIPTYINELAIEKKLNFSKFLATKLSEELGIPYITDIMF